MPKGLPFGWSPVGRSARTNSASTARPSWSTTKSPCNCTPRSDGICSITFLTKGSLKTNASALASGSVTVTARAMRPSGSTWTTFTAKTSPTAGQRQAKPSCVAAGILRFGASTVNTWTGSVVPSLVAVAVETWTTPVKPMTTPCLSVS